MPEDTDIIEKRVTSTVIRRRTRKKVEKKPVEEPKEITEGAEVSEVKKVPKVKGVPKAKREVPEKLVPEEVTVKKRARAKAKVAKEEEPLEKEPAIEIEKEEKIAQPAVRPKEEVAKEKFEKAKPAKPARRSRADLLMEEYSRAGGLKRVAALSTISEEAEVDETIVEPMDRIFQPERLQRRGKRVSGRKEFKKTPLTVPSTRKKKIKVDQDISVSHLANAMSIKGTELIQKLISQGMMVSLNDRLDLETAEIVAADYGYEIENITFREDVLIPGKKEEKEPEEAKKLRAPVVTVMGHVDHGKTSLLDYVRKTNVAEGEAGGITQHIGAYQVTLDNGKITFVDTPGHEAFTSMRARGAQVTDIVILVVAADDGVKPQTIEAIDHTKEAGVPIIVAINKMDKAGANADNVKRQLSQYELLSEDWGGDVIMVPISAHTGKGIDSLLEMILLQAEVLELKANPDIPAEGIVIEARLEKGRGPLMTVIVKEGTLRVGDPIIAGVQGGRVRAMSDPDGNETKEAGPSFPVEVIGLAGVPSAGDHLHVLKSDEDVKRIIEFRKKQEREEILARQKVSTIDEIFSKIQEGKKTELKVILKADVYGSIDAVCGSLERLSTEKVVLNVIHSSVGAITESDVMLAEASQAVVIGFNVRPDVKARKTAEDMGVSIKTYRVIYDVIEDIKKVMEGLLEPTFEEEYLGRAEVRDVFNISKVGTIAGSSVVDGKVIRGCRIRILREGTIIYEGKLEGLKRFKEDAKEVSQGYECGISIENFNDIKVGDILEAFQMKKIASTL